MTFTVPSLPWRNDEMSTLYSADSIREQVSRVNRLVDLLSNEAKTIPELNDLTYQQIANNYPTRVGGMATEIVATEECWQSLAPQSDAMPANRLFSTIESMFNSWDEFKMRFTDEAVALVEGGRTTLAYFPQFRRLQIVKSIIGEPLVPPGVVSLVTIDASPHSTWLDYGADVEEYVDVWWSHINWERAARKILTI